MKYLSFLLRRIWCVWFFLSGFLFFLPLYPVFLLLLSREDWFIYAWRLKKIWAHWILFTTGIWYTIKKESALDPKQAYIITPNHSSYLDILTANIAFPNYFHFMGKAELRNVPMFNIFFKRMNISVDRSSIKDSHKAYKRARKDLVKGISLAIFPEATIPPCAPELGPFKNGAFKLAIEMQIPIVPITFLDNWSIFPDRENAKMLLRPGRSRIIIHKAISTTGLTEADANSLRDQVREIIRNAIEKEGKCPFIKCD
ncbi:MAG: 1-acyl-sn-glycerol-3-phosphate acyltransferase [Bacteroidetes bacterium]|nr:1-acyl-sn-glycerol-3-phosphate acyltransferase [Bacteroidota bacterium]MBL0096621.1 1-acyl-sn-glycerol-3-phosphate acyltransferase [Bacteroidota bacterium]